jgi:sensor histidine kinase YesM
MKFPTDPRARAWLIAVALWAVNIPLLLAPAFANGDFSSATLITVATFLIGGILICVGLYEWLHPWATRAPAQYFAAAIGGTAVSAILLGLIDGAVGVLLSKIGMTPDRPLSYILFRATSNTIFVGWMFAIFVAGAVLIDFNGRLREREAQLVLAESQTAQARATATAARLAALRYQLNPHFLFNTLNAVSAAVVAHRNADAETMLERLASFLRQTLSLDSSGFLRLEDELGTVEAYLEIEAERFRERLSVEILCPERLRNALAPSFVLQPLVENAIKHGVARSRSRVSLVIQISATDDDLVITVRDDARPLKSSLQAPGSGIGLTAIRERLEVLYGARGVVIAEPLNPGFRVILRLPLQIESAAEGAA